MATAVGAPKTCVDLASRYFCDLAIRKCDPAAGIIHEYQIVVCEKLTMNCRRPPCGALSKHLH